jgi:hypothetical protein
MRLLLALVRVSLFVALLSACSGSRSERISCTSDDQCDPDVCLRGYCTSVESAAVNASARSVGVEAPVFVIDASGQTCEASACSDLPYGTQVTFHATEVPGYRFTGWSGSPECQGALLELVIASLTVDTACDANYSRRLRVSGSVAGGESGVIASADAPSAQCTANACEVDAETSVRLTASERWGERFVGWSGAGCGASATPVLTVTPKDSDVRCSANFVARLSVGGRAMNADATINVSTSAPNPVCEPGSCIVDQGATVTLAAPLVRGYRFGGWSGSAACSGSDSALVLADVREPQLCLATYFPRVHVSGIAEGPVPPPAVIAESGDLHKVCAGPACEVDKGGAVTLLATSAPGYRLTQWSGPQCEGEVGAAVVLSNVESDLVCRAQYVLGIAVIGSVLGAPGEVIASSTTPGSVCAAGGCRLDAGGNATLTAPAMAGYRFQGWSGDHPSCTGGELAITLDRVTDSRTCYARYAARYIVRGSASPSAGGSVVAASSSADAVCADRGCTLDLGGEVTLEARPAELFRFTGWSGGGACTGSARTIRVTDVQGNVTCQANFVGRVTARGEVAEGMGTVVARSLAASATCDGASCAVDQGSSVALMAVPAVGFRFAGWSECATGDQPTLELPSLQRDTTCRASFVPQRFTVAGTVTPAGSGSVVASSRAASAVCEGSSCAVGYGSSVALAAVPAEGFRFVSWSGCRNGSDPELAFASVTANVSCQANFTRVLVTVGVSATPGDAGTVEVDSDAAGASCTAARCTVPYGSRVDLRATPRTGFRFVAWSGCGASGPAELRLASVTGNLVCQASFERLRFTVAGTAAPAVGGTIVASSSAAGADCTASSCVVNQGSAVTLTARAASGFRFTSWSCAGANGATLPVNNVRADVSCRANFTGLSYAVAAVAGEGGAVAAMPGTGASCEGTRCTVAHGGSVVFVATPSSAAGYEFAGWSGAGCGVDAVSPLRASVNDVTGPVTCTASFQLRSYAVAASAGAGGSVASASAVPGTCASATSCVVTHGGVVSFTASVAAGYTLTSWAGGCVADSANPLRGVLRAASAPTTCTVSFAPIPRFTVRGTAIPSAGGSVVASSPSARATCEAASCTVEQGGSVTLTARAASGYSFEGWSCSGAVGTAVTLSNVGANISCQASFALLPTPRFMVAGSAAPAVGGTVAATSSSPGATCQAGSCTVDQGATVTLTATAAARYQFSSWSCPGANGPSLVIASVAAAVQCVATFVVAPPQRFTVSGTAAPATGGTVIATSSAAGAICQGASCSVDAGSSAALTARPADGYDLSTWSCARGTATTIAIDNVVTNVECQATFTLTPVVTPPVVTPVIPPIQPPPATPTPGPVLL